MARQVYARSGPFQIDPESEHVGVSLMPVSNGFSNGPIWLAFVLPPSEWDDVVVDIHLRCPPERMVQVGTAKLGGIHSGIGEHTELVKISTPPGFREGRPLRLLLVPRTLGWGFGLGDPVDFKRVEVRGRGLLGI